MNSNFGESIEDYAVLDLLGKGGFACVYRAKCKTNGLEVAIKMIDKKVMQAAGMISRVRNEVEIHSRLKHPSILELYNYFEDANYVYLVLEMCQNGELNRYLKTTRKRLTEAEARRIFGQAVQGLLYLHSHTILHRDLSLSNLLLTRSMDAKIADFGLAAQLKCPDEKHYTMCGTPNYIAPEIAARNPHGLESDVWSLGCMLYTLLVGQPPFDTEGVKSTLRKVVSAEVEIPRTLSSNAQDLITNLLKKHPAQRLRLSQIPDHPFMRDHQPAPGGRHTRSQELSKSGRNGGLHSLSSLDSGNATMSSTHTSQQPGRGPLRATLKPRGLAEHTPSALTSLSVGGTTTHHYHHHHHHRRTHSTEVTLSAGEETSSCSQCSRCCDHSHPPVPATPGLHRRHSSSCGALDAQSNKENSVVSVVMGSKLPHGGRAWSDSGSVGYRPRPLQPRKPFRDTTNVPESIGSIPKKGVSAAAGDRCGSLKELVSPLNAARLRPIRQQTRSATVSVTNQNKVCLQFIRRGQHLASGGGSVGEIVQVSRNGMDIEIFRPLKSTTSDPKQPPSPEHEGFYLHSSYTYHDLPPRYWKKYQYAAQFVQLVRSKTPKVTLYTEQAKCMLMENGPSPDFEACFYNGAKIHQSSGGKIHCIEEGGVNHTLEEGSQIPETLAASYRHTQTCLQKCRDIEAAISSLEQQSSDGTYFPVTVRRRPAFAAHQKSSRSPQAVGRATAERSPASLSTMCQVSPSVLGDIQVPSHHTTPHDSVVHPPPERARSKIHPSLHKSRSDHSISSHAPSRISTSTRQPLTPQTTVLRSIYIQDTGWASQLSSGEVWIQYNDGSQLSLQPSGSTALKYTDTQGKKARFGRNDQIPDDVKTKLVQLPQVLESFAQFSKPDSYS